MSGTITPLPTTRVNTKTAIWTVIALAALSVIVSTEIPILRDSALFHAYRLKLIADRHFFIPHAACGVIALLSGPIQFSSRLRRKHLQLHRILGRVYVIAVLFSGLSAFVISDLGIATWTQATTWIVCTVIAFLTARNRHIAVHKQWMVRSYALTCTFISLRVLNFWPWYVNLSDADAMLSIIVCTFLSVFVADIAFNWREITTSRA